VRREEFHHLLKTALVRGSDFFSAPSSHFCPLLYPSRVIYSFVWCVCLQIFFIFPLIVIAFPLSPFKTTLYLASLILTEKRKVSIAHWRRRITPKGCLSLSCRGARAQRASKRKLQKPFCIYAILNKKKNYAKIKGRRGSLDDARSRARLPAHSLTHTHKNRSLWGMDAECLGRRREGLCL
jgi:hypothetical protein